MGAFQLAHQRFYDQIPPVPPEFNKPANSDAANALRGLNARDGGSLLIRVATELGVIGMFFLGWVLWRFRSTSLISTASSSSVFLIY